MDKKKRMAIVIPSIVAFVLTVSVFFFLWLRDEGSAQTLSPNDEGVTVLVAGVDEAGYHTDMLMLCSVCTQTGEVKLVQIPRDTYFRTQNGEGKINRIYAGYVAKYGRKEAAERFCAAMSEAFDLQIDGFVIFDAGTVKDFVDLLGGVSVNVPNEISYFSESENTQKTLPAGERVLCGEEALALVRHRKSYAEGDLGRLGAQMRFLSGVCKALPKLKRIEQYLGIYQKILPNLLTNLKEKDIISLMMAYLKQNGDFAVSMMRLPGEALSSDGIWYYVLHRGATERMLCEQLSLTGYSFDREERFMNTQKEAFRNAYGDPNTDYRIFTPEQAAVIKVLKN